jgi:hypothetical protein
VDVPANRDEPEGAAVARTSHEGATFAVAGNEDESANGLLIRAEDSRKCNVAGMEKELTRRRVGQKM